MALADTATAPSIARRLRNANPILLSALVLAIAPLWQLSFGVNADASWIITMCERVLAGDKLYIDLIETNPPFTVWMFVPPVLLARWIGVAPEITMHLYTYALCMAGLGLAGAIVRRADLPERDGLMTILPVIVVLLVIFPAYYFAEREHIGTALLLPLLALMAWRVCRTTSPAIGWSVAAGLCASVLVLVKPYYAVMILAPALWVAWQRKSVLALLAPEYWVICLVCVAYLTAVVTIHPEFLADVYPLLRDTYMRTSRPLWVAQTYGPVVAIVGLLIFRLQWRQHLTPLTTISLPAAAGGLLPLVYQGKGWAYHAYPAFFLMLAILAFLTWRRADPPAERSNLMATALFVTALGAAAVPFVMHHKPPATVIETVRSAAPNNPSVALIGRGIQAGHPFTRRVDGHWISSYCSDWLGGFALGWAQVDRANGRTALLSRYDDVVETYSRNKVAELKASNPDIVLLQKNDEHWTEYFMARSDMTGFMGRYDLLTEDSEVWVYLLKRPDRS